MTITSLLFLAVALSQSTALAQQAGCNSGIYAALRPLGNDPQVRSFCAAKFPVAPTTTTTTVTTVKTNTATATATQTVPTTLTVYETSTASTEVTTVTTVTTAQTATNTAYSTVTQTVTSTSTLTNTLPPVPATNAKRAAATTTKKATTAAPAALWGNSNPSTTKSPNPLSTILSQASSVVKQFCICIQPQKTVTKTAYATNTQATTVTVTATNTVPTTITKSNIVTDTNTKTNTVTVTNSFTTITTIPTTATTATTVTVTTSVTSQCPAASPSYCAQSQSCVNFQNDRKNCGRCANPCTGDNSCYSGVCANRNSCNRSTFYCSNSNNCVCFATTSGGGVCSVNGSTCTTVGCTDSQNCANGEICTTLGCCIRAQDLNTCPNPPPSKLFVKRDPVPAEIEHGTAYWKDGKIWLS